MCPTFYPQSVIIVILAPKDSEAIVTKVGPGDGIALRIYSLAIKNLLEHLVSIIIPWVDIIQGCIKRGGCILLMTDSTTSKGWSRKTNFS